MDFLAKFVTMIALLLTPVFSSLGLLNKSLTIDSTISRRDFWYFILFSWLLSIGASILDIFVAGNIIENILSILFFVPTLTAAIRRMHDTDHAGWWLLVPFANIVFLFSSGTESRWKVAE